MTEDYSYHGQVLGSIVSQATRVATVAHVHPDGDAVGSSIAVASWLESLGKRVRCLFPDPVPESIRFAINPQRKEKILVYADSPSACEDWIKACDLIIILDMNCFSRADGLETSLEESKAKKVLIDHHLYPKLEEFDHAISFPEASSTAEVVYYLIKELGVPTSEAATALMTGMTTDTNNFSNSTRPQTLKMASELLVLGVDRDSIVENINQKYRENRLRALGMLLYTRMRTTQSGAAWNILYKEDLQKFDLWEGDTEGFVNIPLAIGDVRLSILLKEEDGLFRVSIRSKKGTSAEIMARQYFHGGGHENAAGGKVLIPQDIPSPAHAEEYIEKLVKTYLG